MGNVTVTGNDGIQPVYNPNSRWQWWALPEIWTGTTGANKYVPNVNDYVMDYTTYTVYQVEAVDPTTLLSTLVTVVPAFISGTFTPPDTLLGVGPGTQSDTYRVYLDTTTTPYTLAVDDRLRMMGTEASYCKIFLGSVLDNTGTVISMVYDSNGNFVSQNVPLELVGLDNITNYSIKIVSVCNTTTQMNDGEVVTVVVYGTAGNVVSKRQLLVENTSFIRSVNASLKYITSIELDSPFMSATQSSTINFPLNVPVNALNITGIVNYSDGSSVTMPIDGNKFSILGLGQYISTIVGQSIPLVASYMLGTGEVSYNTTQAYTKYITSPYNLVTTNPNNSYGVKIYGYPEWTGTGYTMRWFLFNLDRNIYFDVTAYVQFATSTGAFNPTLYGYLQRKSIQLDLSKVSGTFLPYIATQLVDITLLEAPSGTTAPWTMSQVSGSDVPAYGSSTPMIAKISSATNYQNVDITAGITDYNTWLQQVYQWTFPLVNTYDETAAPTPTHINIIYGNTSAIYPITAWNTSLQIGSGQISNYSNVYIQFINRTTSGDQLLSIAGMLAVSIG